MHDEARVFKYGSGSGTNFSKLRGKMERLSGGGTSSGLMSFLEVLDKAAGATKSGGITRRAAKMVVLNVDHPEIRDFIQWKAREEKKVAALIASFVTRRITASPFALREGFGPSDRGAVMDAPAGRADKAAGSFLPGFAIDVFPSSSTVAVAMRKCGQSAANGTRLSIADHYVLW